MKTAQQCAVFLFNFSQTNTTPMKYKILTLLLLFSVISIAQQTLNLIPKPQNIEYYSGSFVLNSKTVIQADKNSFEANYLKELIKVQTGLDLKVDSKNKSKSIHLLLKEEQSKGLTDGGYELNVSNNKIVITASSNQGLFHGIQTLLQLIPFERKLKIGIPWLKITDEPKFQWRGMHLDVSRHFFPKDFIKKYIDYLAMYKMNTFHWHLTDDQGWRIEIKKYPNAILILAKQTQLQ